LNVPPTRTPFKPSDLIAALSAAHIAEMGHPASHETLAILCAQVALETANGASCVQWNLANVKAGPGPDTCDFTTFEYVGPVKTTMVCAFSAWCSLTDGAQFLIHYLAWNWPEAWSGAVVGDALAFCVGLKKRGFFTAPVELYAKGVSKWRDYYLALLGGDDRVTEPDVASLADLATEATTGLLDGGAPTT
jgi:hypothetical protein